MDSESPLTPDLDLPGHQDDQANLDIVVEPEAEPARARPSRSAADASGDSEDEGASASDPEVGNTLIRPENS
jgi:hypothetical protein